MATARCGIESHQNTVHQYVSTHMSSICVTTGHIYWEKKLILIGYIIDMDMYAWFGCWVCDNQGRVVMLAKNCQTTRVVVCT